MSTQSLSRAERTAVLARLAHELTICARTTYEVGTENVLEPSFSLQTILEMVREFGGEHNRVGEIESALNRAMPQPEA
ncbi:MAG: hypothetical protein LAO19_14035 [Acidobacteriia bacterium]|nr:hypothetical protein [Terriglobia bacterium]